MKKILLAVLTATVMMAGQAPAEYPKGPVGDMVKLGEDILNNTSTHELTKDLVGNK